MKVSAKNRSRKLIKSFEAKALRKRSFAIKIADLLTSKFGTVFFLIFNVVVFIAWIIANSGRIDDFVVFDPFPFILLTMVVSLEAIVLSIIVLISQNRQSQIDSMRQELQLQVELISEREITKSLKLLKEIKHKLDEHPQADDELEEMIKEVDTTYIERRLEEQLHPNQNSITQKISETVLRTLSK